VVPVAVVLGAMALCTSSQAGGPSAPAQVASERAAGSFDAAAFAQEQHALHVALTAREVAAGLEHPVTVNLSPDEAATLRETEVSDGRLLIGVTKRVGLVVDFNDLAGHRVPAAPQDRSVGAVSGLVAGGFVWSGAVHSDDATALRLHLANFHLPRGAALYVYHEGGQVRGPYTDDGPSGTGDFWTHTIVGSTMRLQLTVPSGAGANASDAATFDIAEVSHLGPRAPFGGTPVEQAGSTLCSFNEPCVENASCSPIPTAIVPARDAVAMIEFGSFPFVYLCTGGLIADSDGATQIPYFLTANHCINRSRDAASVEAFFQYSTPCGGVCVDPNGTVPSTLGSDIVASDKATDFTLLRLRQPAPAGSVFLGWSSAPVAFSDGTPLFRISHPAGAPQAYSEHVVDVNRPTCTSWPRGDRIYSSDIFGATEGGSSGSPVLNAAGQIVGQLSGACGYNVNDPCDAVSNATVDGAFATYYSQVASILGGGGTTTTTIATTTSTTVATTTTSTTVASTSTTSTTLVSTTTTSTVPPACALPGDTCSVATDCCSGTCRGKPGSRACK